jgi:hypothetical protein
LSPIRAKISFPYFRARVYPVISPKRHPQKPARNNNPISKYHSAKKAPPARISAVAGRGNPIDATSVTAKKSQYW